MQLKQSIMSFSIFLVTISMIIQCSVGLYQDQAGLFDWKQDYIGRVLDLHWDQSHQPSGKRVLVSSEKNVIAYLNANDGSIVWRRMFEESKRGRIDAFLYKGDVLISVHAGGQFVRRWQVTSGSLQWEKSLTHDIDTRASGLLVTSGDSGDQVIVVTSTGIHCLKISDGSEEWSRSLPAVSVSRWYVKEADDGFVAVGVTPGQKVTSVSVSPQGDLKGHRHTPAPWVAADTSCLIMEDNQHFVCYAPETKTLQLLDTSAGQVFMPTNLRDIGVEISSESCIESIVPLVADTILFRSSPDSVSLLSRDGLSFSVKRTLTQTLVSQVSVHGDKSFLLTLTREKGTLVLAGRDLQTDTDVPEMSLRFPFASTHGNPVTMFPFLFSRKKDSISRPKLIFLAQDVSLHFAQKAKTPWKREEAMAYIQAVQMVDLPISVDQAKFEDEFGREESLLVMFVKRIRAQVSQLMALGQNLLKQSQGFHSENEEEEEALIRDDFNLHKVIVVATSVGKVFGLRSQSGRQVWQMFVSDLRPFQRGNNENIVLVVQRTAAHFPHTPQASVLGVSRSSGNGLLVTFNPVTGVAVSTPQDLGYRVIQAEMMAEMDGDFLKGLILVDADRKPHIIPVSASAVLRSPSMHPFFTLLDPDTGLMSGYRLLEDGRKVSLDQVWSLDLQVSQQTVTGVYRKRTSEQVHSQGRVLGDRSVLYKYLNPNLAAVVAEGQEPATSATGLKPPSNAGPFFSLYLVDLVTGHLVYSQTHKRARGPVKVIHSENWVLYSYFSERYRRTEVGILELYEGKAQSNSTAFSSFSPPSPPLVLRQAYIFPEPVYAMEATVTEKGITSKNIMVALKMGGVLSLPKALLDPRRPVIPTRETMEEGTIPYVPEIGMSTEALVNYNKSVFQVRGVFTWPAGLESTSLVLVYGTDVFYTRVMPSRMFDVLKEDFDYVFIGGVLALFTALTILTQKLASRKAMGRAWK